MGKWKLIVGILLVLGALGVVLFFALTGGMPGKVDTVKIYYGSEKKGLLGDPEFIEILAKKYKLAVDGTKMGSLEMAQGAVDGVDGLWPSSELAALVFKQRHSGMHAKQSNIFNTPIVFYSWPDIVDVLIDQGIVEKRDNVYYVIDVKKYLAMMREKKTWKDLGLPRQNGYVSIHSTDPTKSNSGFLLTGFMAVILNDGNMVDESTVENQLEAIRNIYTRMGFLESSTGILFDKYIKQGQGALPLISAYESLIIEFYRTYPEYRETIRNSLRVLIPEPTVWSGHPFIALSPGGETLLTALQDPEIQKLAWDKYGFRSGVLGVKNDPAILSEIGLPERIDSVTPLPSPAVMEKILNALR